MPFDGNGTYNPPAPEFPAISGEVIYASDFNAIINDIAAALSDCIAKDGQTGVMANIDFGGNRIVNVAPGVAATDVVTKAQAFTNPTYTTTTAEGMLITGTGFTVTVTNTDMTGTALHVALQAEGNDTDLAASTAFVTRAIATLGLAVAGGIQAEEDARIAADLLKAPIASPAFTGIPTAPEPAPATDSSQLATCHFTLQQAFQTVLPNQTGNAGKILTTDGTDAEWVEATSTGDVLFSTRTLPFPDFLPCDGTMYPKTSYPALFDVLANGPGVPPEFVGVFLAAQRTHLSASADGEYIGACGSIDSPYVTIFKYDAGAFTAMTYPVQASATYKLALSTDGTYALQTFAASVYKKLFKRTGTTYAEITAPTTAAAAHNDASFSETGACSLAIATASATYTFSQSGDTFTALAATSPATGAAVAVRLTPDGQYMVVGTSSAPYLRVYKDTGAGAMVGMTAPTDIPAIQPSAVAISPAGDYIIAVYGSGAVPIAAWKRVDTTWTRVPAADVATGITSGITSLSVQWDTGLIAVGGTLTPANVSVTMYRRDGDSIFKHPAPDVAVTAGSNTGVVLLPTTNGNRLLAYAGGTASFKLGADTSNLQAPKLYPLGVYDQVKGFIKS